MTDRASTASKSAGPPDPLIGRVVNERFKISALIARGGMGKVYRAEQAPLGRVCALKVLNPSYAGDQDPEFHKRFFLEASIASKLTHPNTVTIFDYGKTDDDVYFMAMEYLDGCTLYRAIREATHFAEERAAHVARQICRALREAHALGVIHRDLKPANIFLVEHGDETDFVKVLDFGLVKNISGDGKGEDLTQTGLFMGSPKYMAPEQIRGDRVDARTDIYALGIIMYEMITGKVPFDRPNSVNILMAHVNEEPPAMRQMNPNITLSPAFEETVMRCMAKDPDQRFRSMDEVLAALKRVGGGTLTATVSGVGTGEYRSVTGTGSGPQVISNPPPVSGAFAASASGSGPASIVSPLGMPSDSPASGSALVSPPPPRSGSKSTLVVAVIGALCVAGIVGWVALRSSKPATAGPTTAPTTGGSTAPATGSAAPSASAPPAALFAKVRVTTTPSGASVREDGAEICGGTPCDIQYKGGDADPTRDHKLTFVKAGFKDETRTVHAGDSPLTVTLAAAPAQWRPPPPAKPADTPTVPQGYKPDIPY
jgi:eukaryotic-like serine/threonine-protein kinase